VSERWVDGFNVMHKLGGMADRLAENHEGAREKFLRLLAPLVFRGRERWTVVFDGQGAGRDQAPGPIRVIFAPDADAWIIRSLESHLNPKSVTVVSSDEKDIGGKARALGAQVESAESLASKLRRRVSGEAAEPEKPESSTSEEIDFWLDQFGGGETGEPKGDL